MGRETIVVERVLEASPKDVFDAWSSAESMRAWMAPGPTMRGASVEADFRVGGSYRIVMHDADRDYVHRGEYLEIAPPKRIVMTWVSEWLPPHEMQTLVRLDLEPLGRRHTRLVLTHSELSGSGYEGHPDGWATILAKLGMHLRRAAGGQSSMGFDRQPTQLPGESPAYRQKRAALLAAELDLRDQIERVAALRRELPRDTVLPGRYTFELVDLARPDRTPEIAHLEDLFEPGRTTLILLHFMYGKAQSQPCPMCTLWADGYDGIVPHLRQRASFAVVVAGDVAVFREYARGRGWRNLRLLSSGASSLKGDLAFEDDGGHQYPGVSVFTRDGSGRVSHFYSQCAILAPGETRGMDLLTPLWSFLDLTPEGRGDFLPKRQYGA